MLEFVNDPQFDGLPLVGEGHVLVARRTECGRAARWVPGGDVVALAEFLGPQFPVVGERLFEQRADGSLFPVDLSSPFWVLVPPAGEPVMHQSVGLTSVFAQVVSAGDVLVGGRRAAAEVNVPPVVMAMSDGGPSVPTPVISGPGVAAAFAEIKPPAPVKAAVKKAAAPKKETAGD